MYHDGNDNFVGVDRDFNYLTTLRKNLKKSLKYDKKLRQ